jgi:DNA-binding MarR family transcriptional regulator
VFDPHRETELRQAIEELYFGYRAFTALPDRMLADLGLGRTHHRILYFVHREPGISVGDLLAVLEVTKQALHRPTRELEERGLLTTTADVRDRRIRRLAVTATGAELEAQLSAAQMRLLDAAFRGLDESAEEHWHQVMSRLHQHSRDDAADSGFSAGPD